jgi:acetyl-CoA acetyltransferase family protein
MKRIAIVQGIRTPFCKANGLIKDWQADDLGSFAIKELVARIPFSPALIDEVILGNVLQPSHATNIARVSAVKAGLPESIPAFTVNRNCSSGMEAVTTAANKIALGQANIIVAGGMESMSNFPILFPSAMKDFLMGLSKARGFKEKFFALLKFRPSLFYPQVPEIADPLCGLSMGQTAEILSRDFKVSREEQDEFALRSQLNAAKAESDGRFKEEIAPILIPPKCQSYQTIDDGPRATQTLDALQKLKPVFDKVTGSVTAGNASPITDGACAILVMSEEKAKELGLKPLGYLTAFTEVGLDPARMGLGPAYAISKLLKETNLTLDQIDLIEINEAFAAQVLAVRKALASKEFAEKALGRKEPVGEIDMNKLNVNGGAIALGHPLGASGARLILTLLLELKKRKKKRGIASLCIGGGQGQACLLEVES